ncbi:hypothetical protein COY28_03540 [Candidatus Woesearchaeota archaeon CG_4_10_14_0_2_um_filter_57_5]|nr:MAG: hypothetical protein AUJ68_03430 [Candidatus Woesearchaeota archaeon CG1_02_57_44]PIN70866.1 MAG: hypothetical protein COV94_00870 [Candidatus Woesearchaeota archaeon CG11_big_fil_rev_8_21_14_0_20_57_5]PIZ53486.1 MAG: hypothetical protein COY28_03540 [Candidatus Woesearchaeota archaeon CG_4_10_14_0_2_um_filter_57_5]
MKHSLRVTLFLIALFLAAHLVGLVVLRSYWQPAASAAAGKPVFSDLPMGLERPDATPGESVIFIIVGVIIGTLLALWLMRFRKPIAWKLWFALAIWLALSVSFIGLFPLPGSILTALAALLAFLKVYKPSTIVHNLTEVFMYGGLAAIFVPLLSVQYAAALLILISIYDFWAVNHSGHMVKLAKMQSNASTFAGLALPYKGQKLQPAMKPLGTKAPKGEGTAILGGGDIGFSLIFSGTVMFQFNLLTALLCSVMAAAGLLILLTKGQSGKFYPAMPAITLGCLLGLAIGTALTAVGTLA